MQLRYTVNFVAHHNRQPGHTHTTTVGFINDRRPSQQIGIVRILFLQGFQEIVVDFKDDLQVTRQNFTQHINRPGFQRLAHQRVVSVGEDLTTHLKRVVPAKLVLIDQQTHHLRNRQHRMSIVEVNRNFIRQVIVGFMQLIMAA